MIITHKLTMDMQKRKDPERLSMAQNDVDTRAVQLTLVSSGMAWIPEALNNVIFRYRKGDGTGGSYDTLPDGTRAWEWEENTVTIHMAPQVLTTAGLVEAQVLLVFGNMQAATFSFQIAVEADLSEGVVEPEDYINWTQWTKQELEGYLEQAKQSGDFNGPVFVPGVDADGNLYWTNNAGLDNPEPVNLAAIAAGVGGSDLNMNNHRITALQEPAASDDAATKQYVDSYFTKLMTLVNKQIRTVEYRNRLDNSDFLHPVNQRGAESLAAGDTYFLDRWWVRNAGNGVSLSGEGVIVDATGASEDCGLVQFLPELEDGSYTLAVFSDSGAMLTRKTCTVSGTDVALVSGTSENGVGYRTALSYEAGRGFAVELLAKAGNTAVFGKAVLYKGTYTSETLPTYQSKGYAAELLECQRYFHLYATAEARPTHGLDCTPHMRLHEPAQGTIVIGGVTRYYNSADL